MGTLGRNFDFRQPPIPQHRLGRYKTGEDAIPNGAPVLVDTAAGEDSNRRLTFELATGAQARPLPGQGGICVWEAPDANFAGSDPVLTRPSDVVDAPAETAAQLVHGTEVRVVFNNTEAHTFRNMRDYAARVMVAGLGATPTVAVGDFLTPGTGNDAAGYWAETADAANAWLVVTSVNASTGEVEAQLLF